MPGESQRQPASEPDPSILTTEQMLLAVSNLEKQTHVARTGAVGVIDVELASLRREMAIQATYQVELRRISEAHRLELKADNQKTVDTAMIAAEKAVQAALAAAEKARDKETLANQLATSKAEVGSKEAQTQMGETFTVAIAGLVAGLNDQKTTTGEIRAEGRGAKLVIAAIVSLAGFILTLLAIGGFALAFTGR